MIPMLFALKISFTISSLKFTILLLNLIEPMDGLSINEIKFNKVDFPEPDGPTKE